MSLRQLSLTRRRRQRSGPRQHLRKIAVDAEFRGELSRRRLVVAGDAHRDRSGKADGCSGTTRACPYAARARNWPSPSRLLSANARSIRRRCGAAGSSPRAASGPPCPASARRHSANPARPSPAQARASPRGQAQLEQIRLAPPSASRITGSLPKPIATDHPGPQPSCEAIQQRPTSGATNAWTYADCRVQPTPPAPDADWPGFKRLAELCEGLFGLTISQGAISNMLARMGKPFGAAAEQIAATVRASEVIASDETSARVKGKTHWQWAFGCATAVYHVIAPTRGKCVPTDFLAGMRPKVWLSDRLPAQCTHAEAHQFCLAHLMTSRSGPLSSSSAMNTYRAAIF
jgi:hypothetical protein